MSCGDLFLALIAVLFPPIAVWIKVGICSCDSMINILLCVLGYIPGLLHAWYIIAKYPERDFDGYEPVDNESQRVTYYYVSHEQPRRNYGTQVNRVPPPHPAKPSNTKPQAPQQTGVVSTAGSSSQNPPRGPAGPSQGAGSEEQGAPPSYSEVVSGDNKIQSQN